jgi:hypothetical protein
MDIWHFTLSPPPSFLSILYVWPLSHLYPKAHFLDFFLALTPIPFLHFSMSLHYILSLSLTLSLSIDVYIMWFICQSNYAHMNEIFNISFFLLYVIIKNKKSISFSKKELSICKTYICGYLKTHDIQLSFIL